MRTLVGCGAAADCYNEDSQTLKLLENLQMATETTVNRRGVAQQTEVLDPAIVKLRAEHKLALVSPDDEGLMLHRLAGGHYGFSYAPQHNEAGLFGKSAYLTYEVHKLADGAVYILCYASEAEARRLAEGKEEFEIEVFPAPEEGKSVLVRLPQARLLRPKPLDRLKRNALKTWVTPA